MKVIYYSCVIVLLSINILNADIFFPNGKPIKPLRTREFDDYWSAIVTQDKIEVYDAPEMLNDKKRIITNQWLNTYAIGSQYNSYFLLMSLDDDGEIKKFLGWVHKKNLQTDAKAMQNENKIFKKALVINRWREVKQGEIQKLKQANVWNGLNRDRKPIEALSLFEIFFIYQEQKDYKGDTYYLIGQSSMIADFYNPSIHIKGWISKKRALNWDTSQALYFNKSNFENRKQDNNLAAIFQAKRNIRPWYIAGKQPDSIQQGAPIGRESDDMSSEPPYTWPRFPILKEPEPFIGAEGNIIKIGYIGDTITRSGQIITFENTEQSRSEIKKLQKQIKNIDIHFVLDTTLTMGPAFLRVQETIKKTVDILKEKFQELKVHFGLVMFKDISDRNKYYHYKRIELQQDPYQLIKILDTEKPIGGGSDEAEASYYGIERSLTLSGPPKNNSLNVLFLITDAVNKPDGVQTVDTLVDMIRRYKISFIPVIQLNSKRAIAEAKMIVSKLNERKEDFGKVINADFSSTTTSKKMINAIFDVFNDYQTLKALCAGAIEGGLYRDNESGVFKLGKRTFGVRMSARFASMMKNLNIDPALFSKEKVQIFETGYIAEQPENANKYRLTEPVINKLHTKSVQLSVINKLRGHIDNQIYSKESFIDKYIDNLLSKKEISLFKQSILEVANVGKLVTYYIFTDRQSLQMLHGLLTFMVQRPFKKKYIIQVWGNEIEIESKNGNDIKLGQKNAKTIAELIENHIGLPVNDEILRLTIEDINRLRVNKIRKLYKRLKYKTDEINDFLREQKIAYICKNDEVKRESRGSATYFWRTASGTTEYCWIKRSMLP